MKKEYVVSACLAGFKCRFDGDSRPCADVVKLYEQGRAIPICPESLSGLKAPRAPVEWKNGRAINKDGEDKTEYMEKGAQKALEKAMSSGCKKAIVKSRSPSCGYGQIYDGSFNHSLCAGNGLWTNKLLANGFEVYTEENIPPDMDY